MTRFEQAIARFDEENSRDPSQVAADGIAVPRELFMARELTRWVAELRPNASEPLRLAARCQHVCRWQVPRSQFPMDKPGYHRWKNHLKQFHAETAGRILEECGYDPETVKRVKALNLKKNFPHDPEAQAIEDALCLVFLQHQFGELARRSEREKMVNALRKSWNKMSLQARELALTLTYSPEELSLIQEALTPASP
jgi:hypothetical protein